MITEKTLITKSLEQSSGQLEGETILMQMDSGSYFGLGETGSVIWGMLDQPVIVAKLCDNLVAKYEIDRAPCCKDVFAFLEKLKEAQLVTVD